MLRSVLLLLVVGVVGLSLLGLVFSVLLPLAFFAVKVVATLLVGYLILRLVRPDLAERCRRALEGKDGSTLP